MYIFLLVYFYCFWTRFIETEIKNPFISKFFFLLRIRVACYLSRIISSVQATVDASVFICSMSSFTKIRASVKFFPLRTLSMRPVNFRTNSQANWVEGE